VNVYFDTGFFIDYFVERGHSASLLRTADRRGRTAQQLCEDALSCVVAVARKHTGQTSALTLVEAETTLFDAMQKASAGVPEKYRYLVTAARAQAIQVMSAVRLYSIQVIPLSHDVLTRVLTTLELQHHAIRAADAVHVSTAITANSDIIISTDSHVLGLDRRIANSNGSLMRCVDTDVALTLL
jgi:predicted nucleic acid-binding protein